MSQREWAINRKLDIPVSIRALDWTEIELHECYTNGIRVLVLPGFKKAIYVEGWWCCPLPEKHGWVERDGRIIDPSAANVCRKHGKELRKDEDFTRAKYFPVTKLTGKQVLEHVKIHGDPPWFDLYPEETKRVFDEAHRAVYGMTQAEMVVKHRELQKLVKETK